MRSSWVVICNEDGNKQNHDRISMGLFGFLFEGILNRVLRRNGGIRIPLLLKKKKKNIKRRVTLLHDINGAVY